MEVNGKIIAQGILQELQQKIKRFQKKQVVPQLAIILVGQDPASWAYVQQKVLKAKEIGARAQVLSFPLSFTQDKLMATIEQLNNNSNIHGIIVQRPLPEHVNEELVDRGVDPQKDVDGFNPQSNFEMPISMAVVKILEHIYLQKFEARSTNIETNSNDKILNDQNVSGFDIRISDFLRWLESQTIVIFGKGKTGGGPIIQKLRSLGVKPLIIDGKTGNPQAFTKTADIIITAVGRPNIVRPEMLKKRVILVSIGLHKGQDGKLHGDYEEEEIKDVASFYTPSPGGVGPVNVACLLENLVKAAGS